MCHKNVKKIKKIENKENKLDSKKFKEAMLFSLFPTICLAPRKDDS